MPPAISAFVACFNIHDAFNGCLIKAVKDLRICASSRSGGPNYLLGVFS